MYRFAAISFAVLTLAGTLAGDAMANGNYQDSCSNSRIFNGTNLSADCKMRNGNTHFGAFINLNDYIANENGSLVWRRGGNFGATCNSISMVGPEIGRLGAICRTRTGLTVFAFINLGVNIANINGDLRYSGPGHDEL